MLVSKERFNQDLVDINGLALYSYDNYYTDGSIIIDKRCANFENCIFKELDEQRFKKCVEPIINIKNLNKIVKAKNEVINVFDMPLHRQKLFNTKSKYFLLHERYADFFDECTDIYYKNNIAYFFLDLPKIEEDEADEIMFVGAVMVMQGTQKNVDSIIKINKVYDELEYGFSCKGKLYTEFKVENAV